MLHGARLPRFPFKTTVLALASACATGPAFAFQIDAGNPDLRMSLDNTVKYSAAWRVEGAKGSVANNSVGVQAITNDGDQNFGKGLISNRFDLLSEFDLRYKRNYGLRLSGAAWYDDVYNKSNDNPGALDGALVNSKSVNYNQFTDATQKLHGRKAEFLDAFVYGSFAPGDMGLNLKAGRFTQLYGESLFFGSNGIAAAQTSLDLIKALSVPTPNSRKSCARWGSFPASCRSPPMCRSAPTTSLNGARAGCLARAVISALPTLSMRAARR